MSKTDEKGHALLNRFVSMKKEMFTRNKDKRPASAKTCNNVQECNKWRNQVCKEIASKITEIQNAMIGEIKVRSINDHINLLIQEKDAWEDRIKELGGQDWKKVTPDGYDCYKKGDYLYFGRAKDLPGVRETYQKIRPSAPTKMNQDLYKNIGWNYYGDSFETLHQIEEELKLENKLRAKIQGKPNDDADNDKFRSIHLGSEFDFQSLSNMVAISAPNQANQMELEKILLQKRKEQLINIVNNLND